MSPSPQLPTRITPRAPQRHAAPPDRLPPRRPGSRWPSSRGWRALGRAWALGVVFLGTGAAAQEGLNPLQSPEGRALLGRGWDPAKLYDSGDVDRISVFDGGLSLSLPIGTGYPLNGGNSFGLMLTYSSSLWDYETFTAEMISWTSTTPQDLCGRFTQKWPSWIFNAGLGWRLSLGMLYEPGGEVGVCDQYGDESRPGTFCDGTPLRAEGVPVNNGQFTTWRYDGPDGASHNFFGNLHSGVPGSPPGAFPLYSRDGSYLRLKPQGGQMVVEMPDGSRHFFEKVPANLDPDGTSWRPVRLEDAFGNHVDLAYSADGNTWSLTDLHDREYEIAFKSPLETFPFPNQNGARVRALRFLDTVTLPGVGGNELVYRFHYGSDPPQIPRLCGDNYPWGQTVAWPGSLDNTRYLGLLESIELPDGSTYEFSYNAEDCIAAYLLEEAKLPTGGRLQWDFRAYGFPSAVACDYPGEPTTESIQCSVDNDPISIRPGVEERRVIERDGSLRGRWLYDQDLAEYWGPLHCQRPLESVTTVIDPLGHQEAHYFSVYTAAALFGTPAGQPAEPDGGWTRAEFGLPFTRRVSRPAEGSSGTLFLSTEVLDCAEPLAPGAGDPSACGPRRPLASTFVRYTVDDPGGACNGPDHTFPLGPGCSDLQQRVSASRMEEYDPAAADPTAVASASEQAFSDFDGLGHYRRTESWGDFCAHGLAPIRIRYCRGDRQETFVDYSPERGTLDESSNQGFVMPTSGTRWLWNTYEERSVVDRSTASGQPTYQERSLFDFDRDNGFLLAQRTLADNLQPALENNAKDVVARFTAEVDLTDRVTGNVEVEEYLGGDLSTLSQVEYRVRHSYAHGVLESSTTEDPGAAANSLSLVNNTQIDRHTGRVQRSVDAAGVGVSFSYDTASRLSHISPDGETPTAISYRTATPALSARVSTSRNGGGNRYTLEQVEFDGFGRVAKERRLLPESGGPGQEVFSQSCRTYYANGLPLVESTVADDGPSCPGGTSYPDYDALGRPRRIVFPGHTSTDRRRQFRDWHGGAALTVTTEHVARRGAGGGTVMTSEVSRQYFDRLDRRWRVEERAAGPGGSGMRETFYRYDAADRLVAVRGHQAAEAGSTDCVNGVCQDRVFSYDGRGFLLSESHPELGSAVAYSLHDSRGNAGRRTDGRTDLRFRFDFAGRLSEVARDGEAIQRFWWAAKNRVPPSGSSSAGSWSTAGADKTAGKLYQTQQRHRLLSELGASPQEVWVSESFTYQGLGGRLSGYSVRTRNDFAFDPAGDYPSLRFTTSFGYDSLGRLVSVAYPDCSGSGLCPAGETVRQLSYTLDNTWLTGVSDAGRTYASSVSYHPSGQFEEILHGNGVREHREQAADGLPRPRRIYTTGASGGDWDTGPYTYDAASNVIQVGSAASSKDEYLYDEINRLVEARVRSHGGGLRTQQLGYDEFGNLEQVVDSVDGTTSIAVATATNRLQNASYDVTGNLTSYLSFSELAWDELGRLVGLTGTGVNRQYLYTASGERLAVFDDIPAGCAPSCPDRRETWTVRGPGQRVLREYTRDLGSSGTQWSEKDYIYRGGSLLASVAGSEVRHFHLDHLGSPRLVTDGGGARRAYHAYMPFGLEATPRGQDGERMKFTGHERDFQTEGVLATDDESDDLDYMHARYYWPWLGRFVSVDPVLGEAHRPQSWNRYTYALNGPHRWLDPKGEDEEPTEPEEFEYTLFEEDLLSSRRVVMEAQPEEGTAGEGTDPSNTYVTASFSFGFALFGVTRDEVGSYYVTFGLGASTPGPSLTFGDVTRVSPQGLEQLQEGTPLTQVFLEGEGFTSSMGYGVGLGTSEGASGEASEVTFGIGKSLGGFRTITGRLIPETPEDRSRRLPSCFGCNRYN